MSGTIFSLQRTPALLRIAMKETYAKRGKIRKVLKIQFIFHLMRKVFSSFNLGTIFIACNS